MRRLDLVLFDYGTGNLHSLAKALGQDGHCVRVENDPAGIRGADALVLPGVGAFGAAAARLARHREWLREALRDGLPCLGICLGMQLLFESSAEGEGPGLAVFAGRVRRLSAKRIPHMGWNAVDTSPDPLFDGVSNLVAYYANSYVADAIPAQVIGWTDCESDRFAAAVRTGNVIGVQFHPEKSGGSGLRVLRNFLSAVRP
ncbi:MAG: imidazole glycerol phosphate synthase subunit HisH [Longimicrobiales bacterium]